MKTQSMNITHVRATLSSNDTIQRIRQAIYNTNKLGWSVDHVAKANSHSKFLAVRVRDNKLQITDRSGKDITQLIVKVLREKKALNNRDIYQGETFYYNDELYYTKYQTINRNTSPSFLCENVLNESDQVVLCKKTIINLTK